MGSQIIGNIIAALLLGNSGSQTVLFIVFAIIATLGSLSFCCLRLPKKQIRSIKINASSVRNADQAFYDKVKDLREENEKPRKSMEDEWGAALTSSTEVTED